jgi:hypothetical protein
MKHQSIGDDDAPVSRSAFDYDRKRREFVDAWIAKEKRKQELWDRVIATSVAGGVLAFLGWAAISLWEAFIRGPR